MNHKVISIRPFIGAENFELSRRFYRDLGFEETELSPKMSVFNSGVVSFYLQDGYVKDWIDNTMIFMEVDDVERFWKELADLNLPINYEQVRISPVKYLE